MRLLGPPGNGTETTCPRKHIHFGQGYERPSSTDGLRLATASARPDCKLRQDAAEADWKIRRVDGPQLLAACRWSRTMPLNRAPKPKPTISDLETRDHHLLPRTPVATGWAVKYREMGPDTMVATNRLNSCSLRLKHLRRAYTPPFSQLGLVKHEK